MRTKPIIAALGALALVAAPTAASAQRSAPAPAATDSVEPGAESVEGEELRRRGFILPLLSIIAIIVAVVLLTGEDEDPVSP